MSHEEMRKLYWAEPFRPFEIVLADGRRFPVRKPQHICFSSARVVVAPKADDFEFIPLEAIQETPLLREPASTNR
jgi:hypothetical protein